MLENQPNGVVRHGQARRRADGCAHGGGRIILVYLYRVPRAAGRYAVRHRLARVGLESATPVLRPPSSARWHPVNANRRCPLFSATPTNEYL